MKRVFSHSEKNLTEKEKAESRFHWRWEEKKNNKKSKREGIEKRSKLEIVGLEDRFYSLFIFPLENQPMDPPCWYFLPKGPERAGSKEERRKRREGPDGVQGPQFLVSLEALFPRILCL